MNAQDKASNIDYLIHNGFVSPLDVNSAAVHLGRITLF